VKTSEVGPVATAFWRVLLALPILWAWMEIEGRRSGKPGRPSGPRELLALFASGLFLGSTFALWHLSLGLTSVATSTLLVNLAPVFVALGAWLFLGKGSARPSSLAWRWPWAAPRCSSPAAPRGSEGEK
jgi:drug/metabolite transporter (DMT)-like permease